MFIKKALDLLVKKKDLPGDLTYNSVQEIINGQATSAQIGAFLATLAAKGETVEEITGLARAMQEVATQIKFDFPVLDTCGIGGDIKNTFNISTTAAFIAAGCGAKVAKHGNRSISSNSGSADVLEELGINIQLTPKQTQKCVNEIGIGFFFAPNYHPAMKNVMAPRKELGIRTIFNILGPLISPAGAKHQIIGTPSQDLAEKIIRAKKELGAEHILAVSGEDGMDEISLCSPTLIYEFNKSKNDFKKYTISPDDFGIPRAFLADIQCSSRKESAKILRGILENKIQGHRKNIVLLNAAAALIAADKVESWQKALESASQAIETGKALEKLNSLISFSKNF